MRAWKQKKSNHLKRPSRLNPLQARDHWTEETSWSERSFSGASRPRPDWWGRFPEHTPQCHLRLRSLPGCLQWRHLILTRPLIVHNGCRRNPQWGRLATGKCGTQANCPQIPRNLKIYITWNGWSLLPRGPTQSTLPSVRAKVNRPQDFS